MGKYYLINYNYYIIVPFFAIVGLVNIQCNI